MQYFINYKRFFINLFTVPQASDTKAAIPMPVRFFDAEELEQLNAAMKAYDEQRDGVIKRSRDIVKAAKAPQRLSLPSPSHNHAAARVPA